MVGAVEKVLQVPYTRAAGVTLTSNQLKLIAVVAMVFDHCMVIFVSHELALYPFLRIPGKLTAPIMCFLIAEGYYHTANLGKYMGRLFIIALVSHIPFNLAFGYDLWAFWKATDVMWSLLLGLLALTVYFHPLLPFWKKLGLISVCCLLSYPADWNYIAVLMVLFFGIYRGNRTMQTVAHIAVGGLYEAQAVAYGASLVSRTGFFFPFRFYAITMERGEKRVDGYNGDFTGFIRFIWWFFICWIDGFPLFDENIPKLSAFCKAKAKKAFLFCSKITFLMQAVFVRLSQKNAEGK